MNLVVNTRINRPSVLSVIMVLEASNYLVRVGVHAYCAWFMQSVSAVMYCHQIASVAALASDE